MSDSIIGKETLGYRKNRIAEVSSGFSIPQVIQFAHKFTGGETTFSLLNLTTPTAEMPGFSNPSPSVLAGTGINVNPTALKLYLSSTGGRLIQFDSYKVFGTTIQFTGNLLTSGMPAGSIIFGEIVTVAANPIVVGDSRFIRKTYSLAVGQTTLNLGFSFKVGVGLGSSDQIGDIKVYRNSAIQLRNVGNAVASISADGNYQEVDSGNGYGTSIVFNSAPVGQADVIVVEMGIQVSSGQIQIWSELERLQGAIQALATDAALAFGNPISNYLSANSTELERRSFGDNIVSLLSRMSVEEKHPRHHFKSYGNPGFVVSSSVAQTYIPATVSRNNGGGFNGSSGEFTAQKDADYFFVAGCYYTATISVGQISLVSNNGEPSILGLIPSNTNGGTVSGTFRLNAGQKVYAENFQASGSNKQLSTDNRLNYFMGFEIGNN